jgi:hypothetical protein
MVTDQLSANKTISNLEERTKLINYFNEYVGDSWHSLTHTHNHVADFTHTRVQSDETLTTKLHNALIDMRAVYTFSYSQKTTLSQKIKKNMLILNQFRSITFG